MPPSSTRKADHHDARKPRVWSSEHARLNDLIQVLLAEDPSWDLNKQGALEPFTEFVAREMGR